MLDINNTNRSILIHKGLVKPVTGEKEVLKDRATKNLLKTYLVRKERHANCEQEKYIELPKISLESTSLRNNTISSQISKNRHMQSRGRVSTTPTCVKG